MDGSDFEYWEVDYTPTEASLNYYYFELQTNSGTKYLCRTRSGLGELQSQPVAWQLTVYEETFKTPDWLAGGIMYQIFPDRFCRSGETHDNIPFGRKIHENWDDQPDWKPNEHGIITNSDYFGGDLKGITQKLDYIRSLGVNCIYINPIFEAHENHRYNTADYSKIDPMLGTEEDYTELCREAKKRGIKIIIDGVFSHTGDDSIYFNRRNRYDSVGAYNSKESPYYTWFKFYQWP
ncbi:MAG: glycoside hydrolase family 13 protein, partial [Clostridia bacterium]|nr:glycoside hydrolase family 13 protein [Clostridia bacterium]